MVYHCHCYSFKIKTVLVLWDKLTNCCRISSGSGSQGGGREAESKRAVSLGDWWMRRSPTDRGARRGGGGVNATPGRSAALSPPSCISCPSCGDISKTRLWSCPSLTRNLPVATTRWPPGALHPSCPPGPPPKTAPDCGGEDGAWGGVQGRPSSRRAFQGEGTASAWA